MMLWEPILEIIQELQAVRKCGTCVTFDSLEGNPDLRASIKFMRGAFKHLNTWPVSALSIIHWPATFLPLGNTLKCQN